MGDFGQEGEPRALQTSFGDGANSCQSTSTTWRLALRTPANELVRLARRWGGSGLAASPTRVLWFRTR
jgi:hypothetical protein